MDILICGDYSPSERVQKAFDAQKYDLVLEEVKTITKHADYSIVNFESVVADDNDSKIDKCGPNLKCSIEGINALKWAGFDCVTLANNHFRDWGDSGVLKTIEVIKNNSLDIVGGGTNITEASKTLYKEIKGKTIAIINCCEQEFSIATERTAGANLLNPIHQFYAIKEAKEKSDYIIMIVHGGHEHYQLPSPTMQETYRFFIDLGADVVVNHHQHCFSGYELYKDRPIFYGLGNFCFDPSAKRLDLWYEGYMVMLSIDETINFKLIPYTQCKVKPRVELLCGDDVAKFNDRIVELSKIISNPELLQVEYEAYQNKMLRNYSDIVFPFSSPIIKGLRRRGLLPFYFSERNWRLLQLMLTNDAHRSNFIFYIKNKLGK